MGFFESIKRGRRDFWDKYARAREGGAWPVVEFSEALRAREG